MIPKLRSLEFSKNQSVAVLPTVAETYRQLSMKRNSLKEAKSIQTKTTSAVVVNEEKRDISKISIQYQKEKPQKMAEQEKSSVPDTDLTSNT